MPPRQRPFRTGNGGRGWWQEDRGQCRPSSILFKDVDLIQYIMVGAVGVRHGSDVVISVFWLDLGFLLFWILNASKFVCVEGR